MNSERQQPNIVQEEKLFAKITPQDLKQLQVGGGANLAQNSSKKVMGHLRHKSEAFSLPQHKQPASSFSTMAPVAEEHHG